MKIIDGSDTILGRLASYCAKQTLKGEEIVVLNCEKVMITGDKEGFKKKIEETKSKIGSGQKGPKYSKVSEKIVKRAIRGMLPNHRKGRGKIAYKRIKCYNSVPKEFQGVKTIKGGKEKKFKFFHIKDILK